MKVSASLAALAALAGVVAAAPIHTPSGNMTDVLVFEMPLAQFITQRKARDPSNLNWVSDGCTSTPDYPLGFEFQEGCQRHDFAYRNYKQQGRWSQGLRKKVDRKFRQDLLLTCKSVPEETEKLICKALANVYYLGARIFGRHSKRSDSTDTATSALYEEYAEAQEIYLQLVREAQGQGRGLPSFPT